MSDPKIRQLQEDLTTLGYRPGLIDGVMGATTRAALFAYAIDTRQDESKPSTWAQAHEAAEQKRANVPQPPIGYLDLSERCTLPEWRKKERPWSSIKGVTIHQTGCPMSSRPERWLTLKAHYGITYEGAIYRIHPETAMGWHAQNQSHGNVGIEVAGFFCGVEGDLSTRPSAPSSWKVQSMTEAQAIALKELVRYLSRLLLHHGSRLTEIEPHRTATSTRRPDPGSKVWAVAMELIKELGCSEGQVSGDGLPIPEAWDSSRVGIKY